MRQRFSLKVALLVVFAMTGFIVAGGAEEAPRARSVALVADLAGPIGPAAHRHVSDAVAAARERSAEVLVLRINTPGGLSSSTREIVSEILASPIPVVGYVAPAGGHAASAGLYILYATHIAAMAPGTNTGSATPVQVGGLPTRPPFDPGGGSEETTDGAAPEDEDAASSDDPPPPRAPADAMTDKTVNDAVAFLRSLAELRGRNADWAERAVREAANLTANQALDEGVVELIARDVPDLLVQLDGRMVEAGGLERTLATAGLAIERIEPSAITDLLRFISNPNVALILMLIGVYGLIFEFSNPGIGPGIPGAISLLLGLYALNQLPLDYVGLGLIMLGVGLMVAEALSPSFGVMGAGGIVAFAIGSAILIDTDQPAYQISWLTIAVLAGLSFAILSLLLGFVWRAHHRPVHTGRASMVGETVEVIDWSGDEGHALTHGERWNAIGPTGLRPGMQARIVALDGLRLVLAEPPGRKGGGTATPGNGNREPDQ